MVAIKLKRLRNRVLGSPKARRARARLILKVLLIVPKFLVEAPALGIGPRRLRLWALLNLRHKGPALMPNFLAPRDYNEKIQWRKLFDQRIEQIQCSDKLGLRDYIRARGIDIRMPEVLWTGTSPEEIPWRSLPQQFVLKTNHDSGSVWLVADKERANFAQIGAEITDSLSRRYGVDTLEWPYVHIEPRVFAEEWLGPQYSSLPDYKFHCANGRVRFMRLITGRNSLGTKDAIFDRAGKKLPGVLDTRFAPLEVDSPGPHFDYLRDCAEEIAAGWAYVRVDLYLWKEQAWLGEMTFFPMAGWYRGPGQNMLGKMIPLDRSSRRPPISDGRKLLGTYTHGNSDRS